MPAPTQTVSVRLAPSLIRELDALAKDEGRTRPAHRREGRAMRDPWREPDPSQAWLERRAEAVIVLLQAGTVIAIWIWILSLA